MKAGIYLGKGRVEVKELPTPTCGDDDVLVRNICSSICGTDVAVFNHGPGTGHRIAVGGEFGHETVSVIEQVGKNVRGFSVGERVYPFPQLARGDSSRAGTLGGFSEYILCPNPVRERSLYPVPADIPNKIASLIEPFTVGGHAAKSAHPEVGEAAVVFGCGTIGIAAAIMLQHKGVSKVMLCDLSDFRLDIARKLGFSVCNTAQEDFYEKARRYFGDSRALTKRGVAANVWIDAAGAEGIMGLFMEHGPIDSRYVMVAVERGTRPIDMLHLTYSSKSIIGSGGYRPDDVNDVMEIMSSGKWDIGSIITHEFTLDELPRALRTASNPDTALNVIVRI